jgi:hypothetical protein
MKLLLSHSILLILAQRARSGWVDPDTETAFHTTVAHNAEDTRDYELVSDIDNYLSQKNNRCVLD